MGSQTIKTIQNSLHGEIYFLTYIYKSFGKISFAFSVI